MALLIVTSPHSRSLPYHFGENFAILRFTVAMMAFLNVTQLTPVPCLFILVRNFAAFRFTIAMVALLVTSPHPCSLPYYFGENFSTFRFTIAMMALLLADHNLTSLLFLALLFW